MADVTRSAVASVDASSTAFSVLTTYPAGVDLVACQPVYLDANYVWQKTNGTANTAPAKAWGFTTEAAKAGQSVAVAQGQIRMFYGTGLTKNAKYYASATAGELADAASTGGLNPIAMCYDAVRGLVITLPGGYF
jgi:hypothetical protein